MSTIWDWSTTAANNGASDSGINFQEGQAPSTVNNSARQVMGRVAEYLGDEGGALTVAGTANALTVTANSAFTSYFNGLRLKLRIATDNSGAATLNANGIGAKSIRKMVGAGEVALSGGEMQATGIYELVYSSALNSAAGAWLLTNPTVDVPSLAPLASPAFTGNPTAPTPTVGDNDTSIATTAFATGAISTAIAALSSVYQPISTVLTALAGIGAAVAGDIIYASGAGVWARLAKGSAGQTLQMNAGATAPQWVTFSQTQSAVAASGTSVSFTGIPAGVREVTIMARGISFVAAGTLKFRVGPVAGVVSTGYEGGYGLFQSASNAFAVTDGFYCGSTPSAAGTVMCFGKLVLLDATNNVWGYFATAYSPGSNAFVLSSVIALSGALERIQFFEAGGGTFDAGTLNIAWSY